MEKKKGAFFLLSLLLFLLPLLTHAVDQGKFRQCQHTDFCRRNRDLQPAPSVYQVVPGTVVADKTKITADLVNTHDDALFTMEVTVYPNRILRLKVDEKTPLKPRYEAKDVLLDTLTNIPFDSVQHESDNTIVKFGDNRAYMKITYAPFVVELYIDGKLAITANDRGMFNFEHRRVKENPPPSPPKPEGEEQQENNEAPAEVAPQEQAQEVARPINVPGIGENAWSESFGGFTDNKRNGPESIGLDIAFIGSKHVYGIPEHSTGLSLRNTKGEGINENPYRLYNLDVFEYELDKVMSLYGAVPFMISHDAEKTVGVFWLNPTEMFIDVSDATDPVECEGLFCGLLSKGRPRKNTHWMAETGVLDIFFLMGPEPYDMFTQYASLTGTGALPQLFSIGYHQCRWNYRDEEDVKAVDSNFDTHNIPYDVIWLDIEHTDGKRYFTWDSNAFPHPQDMQKNLEGKGRKLVVIIDPHIKRDGNYHIHSEAQSKGLYIKNEGGNDYDGWCWPGSSSYLDFTNPEIRTWWAERFGLDKFTGSTPILYVWNDMNEPSVFNGPEVSMQKDAKHWGGWDHRDLHNVYGYYVHMATVEGLIKRDPHHNDRPFVLSRAFFAGTQRLGAIWTGDNAADWNHLKASVPMLLSMGLAGINFVGADVGGFFNNPDAQLQTRWYQLGAFYPFFRGHAHLDTKRREPWVFGEPYTSHIRNAIRLRYSLLPYWYTLFHVNNQTGAPLLRPLWVDFPKDESVFGTDDSFLVGSELLVKPVANADQTSTRVYLPGDKTTWYDYATFQAFDGAQTISVDTPLDKIPVFVKGGSILPKKERPRRSSTQMADDPFTLLVAVDKDGKAFGKLYLDDGHSFNFQKGEYDLIHFNFTANRLIATTKHTGCTKCPHPEIERIVIVGGPKPTKISSSGKELEFEYFADVHKTVIRKPGMKINTDWVIDLKLY